MPPTYRNHPQLERFRQTSNPLDAISQYLGEILTESIHRGYHFNESKVFKPIMSISIRVTSGQIEYEIEHLLKKLKIRDPEGAERLRNTKQIMPHPMFVIISGGVEEWEKQQ